MFKHKKMFSSYFYLFIRYKRSIRKEEGNISEEANTTTSSCIRGLVSHYVSRFIRMVCINKIYFMFFAILYMYIDINYLTFEKGMKLAQHILGLLLSCLWWDTYLGLVIAMEKIYCSILHAEIAYMLISTACSIG